jgi:hypothetical protein
MFGSVIREEFLCRLLDRFPLLFAGFLFDDLAVALLQSLALAALLRDGLRLAGGAGGTAVPAWIKVRQKAEVKGRWHDNRHTLVTELAESGAGDEVIMGIAGHVSRAMLSRYSHVRMEAKRRALDEIAARQGASR